MLSWQLLRAMHSLIWLRRELDDPTRLDAVLAELQAVHEQIARAEMAEWVD